MSPTERTLRRLRAEGFMVEVVERWNCFSKTKKDLFGCFDLLAISPDGVTHAIQVTTGSNHAARIKKLRAASHVTTVGEVATLVTLNRANWVCTVESWSLRANGRWEQRIQIL